MMVIKKLGVFSCGKVVGGVYACLGLIFGGFVTLFALLGASFGAAFSDASGDALLGALFGLGAVIALPIFYGVLGFVGGILAAWFYNFVVGFLGGLEIEIEPAGQITTPG
jgi:hypothetical protein